jgi:hypothetical protein
MEDAVTALKRWPDAPHEPLLVDAAPLLHWLASVSRVLWGSAHDPSLDAAMRDACAWKAEAYDRIWSEVRQRVATA